MLADCYSPEKKTEQSLKEPCYFFPRNIPRILVPIKLSHKLCKSLTSPRPSKHLQHGYTVIVMGQTTKVYN